jgi:hypothetical protein
MCVALGPLSCVYVALGFYSLVSDTGFSYPIDLRWRWGESHLLLRGLDPQEHGHPDPEVPERHSGPIRNMGGGYPPWAYAAGLVLVPPLSWRATRWYFACLNVTAMVAIGSWAFREARPHGKVASAAVVSAVFSIFPFAICLSYGQYAILIMAFLLAGMALCERGFDGLGGACVGMAMIKPNLAGLFWLALLVRRRKPRFVATSVTLVLGATCVTWLLTGTSPVRMFEVWSREAEAYSFLSFNPLGLTLNGVLDFQRTTLVLAIAGLAVCGGLTLFLRDRVSAVSVFGLCAVTSLFWSYRRHYDCVLLGFLMVGIVLLFLRTGLVRALVALGLLGGSLWLPFRQAEWGFVTTQYLQFAIWVGALAVLLVLEAKSQEASAPAAAGSA